jgi:hypothetical protein
MGLLSLATLLVLLFVQRIPSLVSWTCHFLVLALAIGIGLTKVIDHRAIYAGNNHFNVGFFAVVNAYHGKVPLVNMMSPYGLYPVFLQAVYAFIPLTVLTYTVVMGLLTTVGMLSLWAGVSSVTRNRLLAFLCFLGFVYNSWFASISIFVVNRFAVDHYYMFYPVRFFFPACVIGLVSWHFQTPQKWKPWLIGIVAGMGVLWNLDSGIPTFGAWLLVLSADALLAKTWVARSRILLRVASLGAACLGAVVLGHALITWGQSHQWPDYLALFTYQRFFYLNSLGLLPMPLVGLWMVPVLLYVVGFAVAVQRLVAQQDSPRTRLLLFLALLGPGVLLYYQGRSHPWQFVLAWWPCFAVLTLLLDDLLVELRLGTWRLLPWTQMALCLFWMVGAAATLLLQAEPLFHVIKRQMTDVCRPALPSPFEEEGDFLRRGHKPGSPVLAVSDAEATIMLQAGLPSMSPCPLGMTYLSKDVEHLSNELRSNPDATVLLENNILRGEECSVTQCIFQLVDSFRNGYTIHGQSQRAVLLRSEPLLLPVDPGDTVHVGIAEKKDWNNLCVWNQRQVQPLTIEVVVRAEATQPLHADILSCHGESCQGWCLEQDGSETNQFRFVVGDSARWHFSDRFFLVPGQWHHLAIVSEPTQTTVYRDAQAVSTSPNGPLSISEVPLYIGNWVGGDHCFQGWIREVRISPRALHPTEIAACSEMVQHRTGQTAPRAETDEGGMAPFPMKANDELLGSGSRGNHYHSGTIPTKKVKKLCPD